MHKTLWDVVNYKFFCFSSAWARNNHVVRSSLKPNIGHVTNSVQWLWPDVIRVTSQTGQKCLISTTLIFITSEWVVAPPNKIKKKKINPKLRVWCWENPLIGKYCYHLILYSQVTMSGPVLSSGTFCNNGIILFWTSQYGSH